MTMTNPTPTVEAGKSSQRARFMQGVLVALAVLTGSLLGGSYMWDTRTMSVELTAPEGNFCADGQPVLIPMNMDKDERKNASIISDSTYGGEAPAVTDVQLEIRPSSDFAHDGLAVAGGQLVDNGVVKGAFTVDDPGVKRTIRFNPAALDPSPKTQLELCLKPRK